MTKEIMHKIYEMNQDELRDYICKTLEEKNIPHTIFDGNIYSFRFKDKIAFVSHMDTVAKDDEEYHKPVFELNGVLFKRNAILGADDRAGINLILNHIENINFIITRDEEVGRLGAKSLRDNNKFVEDIKENNIIGFIEMDRRNNKDILGKKHGYCEQDFHDAVFSVLNDRTDENGSCTDIDSFIDLKPAVNISCAYHQPHTASEFLDIEAWLDLNNKIMNLHNNINGEFSLPERKTYKYYYQKSSNRASRYQKFSWYNDDDFLINGYNVNIFSEYNDSYYNSVLDDIEKTKVAYNDLKKIGATDMNPPEANEDSILNLIKHSDKYCCCSLCGGIIKKGERYHIINNMFAHDSCLIESEKKEYGILPLKGDVDGSNTTNK